MKQTKLINQQLRSGLFTTVMSETYAKAEDDEFDYQWVANSGDVMPGPWFNIQLDIPTMSLDRFSTNPTILFNHESDKPVGIGNPSKDEAGLGMGVAFDNVPGVTNTVKAKVDAGSLRGMSVGVSFHNCTEEDFKWSKDMDTVQIFNSELLECSICSIPADAKALRQFSFKFNEQIDEPEDKPDETVVDKPTETADDTTSEPAKTNDVTVESEGGEESEEAEVPAETEKVMNIETADMLDSPQLAVDPIGHAKARIETRDIVIAELRADLKAERAKNTKLQRAYDGISKSLSAPPTETDSVSELHGHEKVVAAFKRGKAAK